MSGGSPYRRNSRLQEVIKKYKTGEGRKKRKSENFDEEVVTVDGKHPSFVTHVKLKTDKHTKEKLESGFVTVPANMRNELFQHFFPGFKVGDYFQVKMTLLTSDLKDIISVINTQSLLSRGRLTFSKYHHRFFNYSDGRKIRFEFQKYIPKEMEGKITSVKALGRFIMYEDSGKMIRVFLQPDIKILIGMKEFKEKCHIHWSALGIQGAAKQYYNREFGISPGRLGLSAKPQEFYAQFDIKNISIDYQQIDYLNNLNREEFVKTRLQPIGDELEITLTGDHRSEKPEILFRSLNNLASERLLGNIEKIEPGRAMKLSDGRTVFPDYLIKEYDNPDKEPAEGKAYGEGTRFKKRDSTQFQDYISSGKKISFFSTANNIRIPKIIRDRAKQVFAYEQLSEAASKSKNPINLMMLKAIRDPWPSERGE